MKSLTCILPLAISVVILGCGDDATGTGGAGGSGATGGTAGSGGIGTSGGSGGGGGEALCTATFTWLQKDAYKETAGRTSDLWPPHTTTKLDVTCPGENGQKNLELVASVWNENHGTTPDAVDANGDVFLVDVKHESVEGTREDLVALVAAYESCECDPSTKFLSLDSLQDAAAQEVVGNVIAYLQTNLTCTAAGGVDALIANLQNGEIDLVLADLPSCTFASGTTFSEGLDEALTTLLAESQEVLGGYHVCNNDAILQATLFQNFVDSGAVQACDGTIAACKGPLWFYKP